LRYVLKQKLFAWGNDFHIRNEAGADVYFVDGKAFSLGDQLSFQDLRGTELAYIRRRHRHGVSLLTRAALASPARNEPCCTAYQSKWVAVSFNTGTLLSVEE